MSSVIHLRQGAVHHRCWSLIRHCSPALTLIKPSLVIELYGCEPEGAVSIAPWEIQIGARVDPPYTESSNLGEAGMRNSGMSFGPKVDQF
jgi:hypothetical protein